MVELVDTLDLKSNDFTVVRVQVPLRVLFYSKMFFFFISSESDISKALELLGYDLLRDILIGKKAFQVAPDCVKKQL